MSSKKKRRYKVWIILVILLGAGAFAYLYNQKRTEKNNAPRYREVAVEKGQIDITVLSTGVVQPQNRLEIKPPISGRVEQILVVEGQAVRKGQILAWMSSTERAALLDAARSKGPEEIKRWEDMYRATPILSPIAGTVILRSVEPGQTFSNTEAVLVLSDRLTVKAQVDETDLAQVKLGQKASIVLDAYPQSPIEGKVDQLAFEAVTTNNVTTYTTDIVPLETPAYMRSGMTANVTFFAESRQDIIIVPSEAIRTDSNTTFVLLKSPDPAAPPINQNIVLGLADGKQTEVSSGLKVGDVVLIEEISLKGADQTKNPLSPFGNGPPGGGRKRPGGP